MKKFKVVLGIVLSLVMCMALTACGNADSADAQAGGEKDKIVIGTEPTAAPAVECIKPVLEGMGYEVEITNFDDDILPDTALEEGSIDCNFYQNTPFMEKYNEDNGTDLMMAGLVAYPNLGLYSTKYTSLDEIPEGSQVSLTNDVSNIDRALRLLQSAGLIKLADEPGDGKHYAQYDITENSKDLQFVAITETQLVESMNDMAIAVCPSSQILNNGLDPKSALAMEEPVEDAMIGLTIRPEDKDAQWVQDILAAYKTDEAKAAFDESFKGAWELVLK